ncbi:hypothetical protein Q9966_006312 [Columba livia]|nr:hypothetical protein Q9966_006312 [Columba livia]
MSTTLTSPSAATSSSTAGTPERLLPLPGTGVLEPLLPSHPVTPSAVMLLALLCATPQHLHKCVNRPSPAPQGGPDAPGAVGANSSLCCICDLGGSRLPGAGRELIPPRWLQSQVCWGSGTGGTGCALAPAERVWPPVPRCEAAQTRAPRSALAPLALCCALPAPSPGEGQRTLSRKASETPQGLSSSCRASSQQRSIAVRCGCPLGDTPPSASTGEWVASVPYCMSPSPSHPLQPQLGADAATASCQRCRGGWLPTAALCAGPLASAASPSVISAGQALCFCRCDGGAGPGTACCPLLSLCSL